MTLEEFNKLQIGDVIKSRLLTGVFLITGKEKHEKREGENEAYIEYTITQNGLATGTAYLYNNWERANKIIRLGGKK